MTPVLSTDLLTRNPTTLHPLNSTEIGQSSLDFTTYGNQSFSDYSNNINILQNNPISPTLTLPFPISGPIGDLLQISGPMILQEIFQEIASIFVTQIFIKIFHLDTLTISLTDLNNFMNSLLGMSIDQFEGQFDINTNDLMNNPSVLFTDLNSLIPKMNFSALDYNDQSSAVNKIGLGGIMRGTMNIDELFCNSFSSYIPFSSQDLGKLKNQIKSDFIGYIGSDVINQVVEKLIDINENKNNNNKWFHFGLELVKITFSTAIFELGTSIKRNVDLIKNKDILGVLSEVEGVEDYYSEVFLFIGSFFSLVNNPPLSVVFNFYSSVFKIMIPLFRYYTAILNGFDQSTYGVAYDFFSTIDAGLAFLRNVQKGIDYWNGQFNILKGFANLLPSNLIEQIPVLLIINDIFKLFVGYNYLNQL